MKKPQHFIKTCLLSGLIMSSHAFAEQIIPATMPNTIPVTQTVTQPATAPSTVATINWLASAPKKRKPL